MATKSYIRRRAALVASSMLALFSLPSCEKDVVEEPVPAEEPKAGLTLVVSVPETRAAVTPYEGDVMSLDLLVFRNGALDASQRVTGTALRSIGAEVSAGVPVHWKVVANAPAGAFGSVTTESAFESALTYLTDGTASSLVMGASGSVTVTQGAEPVPVTLDRYSCKVTVESLEMKWMDTLDDPVVTLERIVLVNVVGSTPYTGVPAIGPIWYNALDVDDDLPAYVRDMTVADYGSRRITSSASFDVTSSLYCMPNPTSNNTNSLNTPTWSERCTRVAVEVKVNGVSNWYPVTLPSMLCNRHYVIRRLVLNGPGSQGPDWPVERDDVSFSVDILPWLTNDIAPVWTGD